MSAAKKIVGVWEKVSTNGGPQLGYKGCTLVEMAPLRLICFGGFGGGYSNEAWLLDIRGDEEATWFHIQVEGILPPRRAYHSGVEFNGNLIIFGGVNQLTLLNDVWQLMIDWIPDESVAWRPGETPLRPVGNWQKVQVRQEGPRPNKRQGHTASMISENDAMLIIGGYDGSEYLVDAWIFNFETQNWTMPRVHGVPPAPRAAHCMGLVTPPFSDTQNSGLAYIYGGYNNQGCLGDIAVLAIGHDGHVAWDAEYTDAVQGPAPMPRYGAAAAVYEGNIYIFGGTGPVKSYKKNVDYRVVSYDEILVLSFSNPFRPAWRLDPKRRNFTGARPIPRHGHAIAATSGQGFQSCLVVTGGSTQGSFAPRDPAPRLLRDVAVLSLGVFRRGTIEDDLTYVTTNSLNNSLF
mmetsp:Transcript_7480/g.10387  ORF Transcript_7480/g.10387 Transcript_7480/m.10387 type:complete len:404 (+) Transcript_7480:58-1269(+)|eukprot:CAMPEP_0197296786 /NCGR_PEP_ID=MMETSP0890-20130614/39316_1 /TAXON_ID=44058 ORGANISM="Aureoumbra lagunensis, Strain CCMP1510" /NCGR_SAMPLE_ID=MMETSP0890 /ASSEMBLY_ACC=CAM_ASM_000533 /LENGTH=403 /DNA_ID=CAMNT_0042773537 /DNA_START=23 /DNA_END=1234 /DNA_ORIENTATION=-